MAVEVEFCEEFSAAEATFESFYTEVDLHMLGKVTFLSKTHLTVLLRTNIWPLISMNH